MDALLDSAATRPAAHDHLSPGDPDLRGIFSGLSREMCRPLISLRAGFDLLLAGCEGPISFEQRDHVQALRAQCDDLLRLTRSYLDYAGLTHGPRPIDWAEFRLGALLEEADRQFACTASARGIAWSCRLDGGDGPVVTDLACFQQVVGELVSNALASTPAGGRIEIRGCIEGGAWLLELEDNGRGIPAEVLDRVFEPLVRLGHGCAGLGDGHGMGLAVCRELVVRLRGEISLRSEIDRGTSVSLRFPREGPGCRDSA
jgi:signal transduction histidine kinase